MSYTTISFQRGLSYMQFIKRLSVMLDSIIYHYIRSRSLWSCVLRCEFAAARLLGLRVRIPTVGMGDFLLRVLCTVL